MDEKQLQQLHLLAKLYQIETTYRDIEGREQRSTPRGIWETLRALGAPVEKPGDLPAAIRERRQRIWQEQVEPVVIVWEGEPGFMHLRLPQSHWNSGIRCQLQMEQGYSRVWEVNSAMLPAQEAREVEGRDYLIKRLPLPATLPRGYHRLVLQWAGQTWPALVIVAPRRAYAPPRRAAHRTWGVFLPLYALHSGSGYEAGNLTDLARLSRWVQGLGGSFTATLPLLAAFLERPLAPSPYSPASRLFWNEFYLDLQRIPELKQCPPARELLQNSTMQKIAGNLNASPLVDYRRVMAVKRSVLELLARQHRSTPSPRQEELQRWSRENPLAMDYARFRAAMEYRSAPWPEWPSRMRDGLIQAGDYSQATAYYHLYVQWLTHQQLQDLGQTGGLYLDLPLGVHNAGYDIWREQALFATRASCGAPPDPLNQQGQNWDLAPLHPEQIRRQGYAYYLAVLRHHLQHTTMLRIDHVMGLHRLFWIPRGLEAKDGVYVQYRAREFYALLTLESCRHRVQLVGEDLGTVPPQVRRAMHRHGINRMYILPFELNRKQGREVNPVPREALAALNTHDMPPFAGGWARADKTHRQALVKFLRRNRHLAGSASNAPAVMEGSLDYLAAGPARFLQISLEDLWLEEAPQNIPGTTHEYPNWRRKTKLDWETFSQRTDILRILRKINARRKPKQFGQHKL